MLPKQRMLIAALIIQAFLFYTPTAAKLLKIFPKDSSFTDILGFEVESVNEKNATVLLSLKRTPLNISVSYSENLGYNNYTSPYDDWDPNKSDDYVGWVTHSNYIATENRLIIPYIVTGFYQFESNSVGEAVYYYIDTTVKDLESLQLSRDDFKGAFEHRKLLRVLLPTRVQQVTRRVINGKEKNPKECPEESNQEGFFIYSCDLSDEFLNNTNEVLVQLHDCRCNQQSIWYHNNLSCKAKYKYDDTVTKSKDPSKQIPVYNELTTIWIFGSVCLMLVVVVGILWLILFIHRRSSTTELPYTTKTVLCFDCVSIGSLSSGSTSLPTDVDMKKIEIKEDNSKHDVVLLMWYPRDCEPFMDLMKEFREYLNKCKGYKVLDLYEETMLAQARELGLNRWLSQALGQVANHGHVLLVWSPCAQHIYTRIKPMGSSYRYPRWTDQAFLLGLSALQPNSTHVNIIHIAIEPMSADPPPLLGSQYLNFELPGHLSLLMTHLGGTAQTESECDSDDDLIENQPNCLGISQQSNSLKQFLKENPSYLKELLEIES